MFLSFAKHEIKLWEELYLDFLSMGSELEAVHYEDLKEDAGREAERCVCVGIRWRECFFVDCLNRKL